MEVTGYYEGLHALHAPPWHSPWCPQAQWPDMLLRVLESLTFFVLILAMAIWYGIQNGCISFHLMFFSIEPTLIKTAQQISRSDKLPQRPWTQRSDIFRKSGWNPVMKAMELGSGDDWSPPLPASGCQRRLGHGSSAAQQRWPELWADWQSWQLCFSALSTLRKINTWVAGLPSVELLQQTGYL